MKQPPGALRKLIIMNLAPPSCFNTLRVEPFLAWEKHSTFYVTYAHHISDLIVGETYGGYHKNAGPTDLSGYLSPHHREWQFKFLMQGSQIDQICQRPNDSQRD